MTSLLQLDVGGEVKGDVEGEMKEGEEENGSAMEMEGCISEGCSTTDVTTVEQRDCGRSAFVMV